MKVIHPAVAGMFYPADPKQLRETVISMLEEASAKSELPIPKAIIAPHAGYIYSGPVAASAYACLAKAKKQIRRVILLAPAHRYPVQGIACTKADLYSTPLGDVKIDHETINKILSQSLNQFAIVEEAFISEHAIEVHLPFLQLLLEDFSLVPLLVGYDDGRQVAKILEAVWGGSETLIIVSSDLSHYLSYAAAKALDKKTTESILALNPDEIVYEQACGSVAIKGLLIVAALKKLQATLIDLRNSGDTSGHKDQVVGYGAYHFR